MQTFLPYDDCEASLRSLDRLRCNKQVVESSQLITALERGTRWANHPAAKMWEDHLPALVMYYNTSLRVSREVYGTNWQKLLPLDQASYGEPRLPVWFGSKAFHARHRARLLDKKPEWYGRYGWSETPVSSDVGYLWPKRCKVCNAYHLEGETHA